jgi:MarR family transcriptional regulator, 2-MHQ and catechol-resistance regulon repressor
VLAGSGVRARFCFDIEAICRSVITMGTRHQGTIEEITALNAFIKLQRAAESVSTRVHGALPSNVTVTQFGVLEALYHVGPQCQGELAEKLLRSGGNLTLVVDNLEKAGFVARERDPADRRFVVVKLTDKGTAFIRDLFPKILGVLLREMNVLSSTEQNDLSRLCKKIGLRR